MTEHERALLRDRVARTRLAQRPPTRARTRTTPVKPDPRVAELENANEHLMRYLTETQATLDQELERNRQLAHDLDVTRQQNRRLAAIVGARGCDGWLDAERHIVVLRRRIAELEADA